MRKDDSNRFDFRMGNEGEVMILVGNIISFMAALFMVVSCVVKDRSKVFQLQFIQCILLAISSWFFTSYAGIVANLIASSRNLVISKGKFTKKIACVFLIVSIFFGTMFNNKGFIGLLPMVANVQFAVCCYLFTGLKETKYSIWLNVLIWIIYSFAVLDFSTGISDSIVLVVNTISIINLHKEEKIKKLQEKENI